MCLDLPVILATDLDGTFLHGTKSATERGLWLPASASRGGGPALRHRRELERVISCEIPEFPGPTTSSPTLAPWRWTARR